MNLPFSGEGTNVKGYEGHGDARWEEQVAEGLEGMQVYLIQSSYLPL